MKYSLASDTWDHREVDALQSVIHSGRYTMGPKVQKYEEEFAERFGKKYAVMTNSGSSANLLMIAAMVLHPLYDLNPGDEVIVPAVSWSTTYFPVTQYGLNLVFVDIDRETLNIDTEKVKAAITNKTKAIFAVNLLGNSCDYAALKEIADEFNLYLLEDNCESLGATYNGKMLGAIGHMGTFSFFFSHHLQTMEGGMVLTDDSSTAQYLRSLRSHGWIRNLTTGDDENVFSVTGDPFEDSFKFVLPGYCVRPLEMSGAVGSVQLLKMDEMIARRRANADYFKRITSDVGTILTQKEIGESSWFGFSIVLQNELSGRRKELITKLSEEGVESRPIVAGNFTKNPVIKYCPHRIAGSLSNSEYIDVNGFFIGNDSRDLTNEIKMVVDIIKEFK